jgi:hypothetical protein
MIILDEPYVSTYLKDTVLKNQFPLLKTETSLKWGLNTEANWIDENYAIVSLTKVSNPKIYTNSENSINWINKNLQSTVLPEKINIFKDKYKFRQLIKGLYPDFFFKEIHLKDLDNISINGYPKPFVIKPSVGFFSLGVYKVNNDADWQETKELIKGEIDAVNKLYPKEVMDTTKFIIEECIQGEEFAVDAYFDSTGQPVILNILKHLFSSSSDVSDRVYFTSDEVINNNINGFTNFLSKIGKLTELKNFPLHVEVRVDENNNISPIEINPMRFGGWCTTADMTPYAYGFNPIEFFFNEKKPNWDETLKSQKDNVYTVIVLDNSSGYKAENIASFDYNKLLAYFENPLELRKVDVNEFPLFGFVFTETRKSNFAELERILKSDLTEFIELKKEAEVK